MYSRYYELHQSLKKKKTRVTFQKIIKIKTQNKTPGIKAT